LPVELVSNQRSLRKFNKQKELICGSPTTFGYGLAPKNDMIRSTMGVAMATKAIPVSESLLRREAVDNALADLRLEGLAPSATVQSLFLQFIDGDLTESELLGSVLSR